MPVIAMKPCIEIYVDENGKQQIREVMRPCRMVIHLREEFLQADIPVFRDQVEWIPVDNPN